jgi:hypothetical protein
VPRHRLEQLLGLENDNGRASENAAAASTNAGDGGNEDFD